MNEHEFTLFDRLEAIWKPVYDEYRRIGYRLDKEEQMRII